MATGATVEERLIADVISDLQAIDVAGGYNGEFAKVARQDRNVQKHPQMPLAIVVHNGVEKDDTRLGMKVSTLSLIVLVAISANENNNHWATNLDLYTSDVETALTADTQRGGLAVKTAITRIDVYDSDEIGSNYLVAARLMVEISFRHLYNDTTSAI